MSWASTFDRRFLGPAKDFNFPNRIDTEDLKNSIRHRRSVAWSLTQRVIEGLAVQDKETIHLPRWLSFYQSSEMGRLVASNDFSRAGLERDWENLVLEPGWNEEFYSIWRARQLESLERTLGVAALSRNYFSSSIFEHYSRSVELVSDCISNLIKDIEPSRLCFNGEFPEGSVAVKAKWRLVGSGIPVFDTDEASLRWNLSSKSKRWVSESINFDETSGAFVVEKNDRRYVLTGLHIMIKNLPDWFWISLWLSPDPNSDFGEDRPDNWHAAFPDWTGYKMCTATGFEEEAEIDSQFKKDFPSLSASLFAIRNSLGNQQWCSNPFIEEGDGNMATNCIGCHQHAGTLISQEEILAEPSLSQAKVRDLKPADYMWSFNQGASALGFKIFEISKSNN